jgi:hypothetical protein
MRLGICVPAEETQLDRLRLSWIEFREQAKRIVDRHLARGRVRTRHRVFHRG